MNNGIQGAMQPAAQAPAPAAAAPVTDPNQPPVEAGAEGGVTPEEQEVYNNFVAQSQMLIYDENTMRSFLKLVKGTKDPVAEMGKFAAQVAFRVMMAAKEAGQELDPEIILQGGAEIVEALVEVNDEGGGPDVKDIDAVFYAAADAYREMMEKGGMIDPAQAQADMQRFAEAEASGELAAMVQGGEQGAAPAAPAPAPAAPMEQV